jgi:hypothetical protein
MNKRETYYNTLSNFLLSKNAKIIKFEYYEKLFGNIILVIEYKQKKYEFITDRGEIYLNDKLVCYNSYHIKTIEKLIEIISEQIFF